MNKGDATESRTSNAGVHIEN